MENISNSSLNETLVAQKVEQMPPVVDYSFRGLCFVIHAIYFLIVLFTKELQKISLIHMHHTNLIGLLTGFHYSIWIAWVQPATPYPELNVVLCTISDAFWAIIKYARCYSICWPGNTGRRACPTWSGRKRWSAPSPTRSKRAASIMRSC